MSVDSETDYVQTPCKKVGRYGVRMLGLYSG